MNYDQKLKQILTASGWSQEKLAGEIGVSFATVNSWVNAKSTPTRTDYIAKIDRVYDNIVGTSSVDIDKLKTLKTIATRTKLTAKKLIANRNLLDNITVNLTYHTNSIEGSTMTASDVSDVIFDNKVLKNRTATEQREAINHQTALNFLLDELNDKYRPFAWTPDLIRAIHLRLMSGIISNAGEYRNHGARIMGAHVPLVNFINIPTAIQNLCNQLNSETTDLIGLMAMTHAEFEKIHPFSDGNGRTGRLILLGLALQNGIFPPIIPRDKRTAYYKYLEDAQMNENYDPLEMLIVMTIADSIDEYEEEI
ncbi:MAG: Fic family protein [Candidatus Nomurabacteria bacterium]|jgi:Fic family protein/DNA-binding Xre family transcriptional regulator|nr:Fic family protein [Candidatus Nomurabacteria bacterium]